MPCEPYAFLFRLPQPVEKTGSTFGASTRSLRFHGAPALECPFFLSPPLPVISFFVLDLGFADKLRSFLLWLPTQNHQVAHSEPCFVILHHKDAGFRSIFGAGLIPSPALFRVAAPRTFGTSPLISFWACLYPSTSLPERATTRPHSSNFLQAACTAKQFLLTVVAFCPFVLSGSCPNFSHVRIFFSIDPDGPSLGTSFHSGVSSLGSKDTVRCSYFSGVSVSLIGVMTVAISLSPVSCGVRCPRQGHHYAQRESPPPPTCKRICQPPMIVSWPCLMAKIPCYCCGALCVFLLVLMVFPG